MQGQHERHYFEQEFAIHVESLLYTVNFVLGTQLLFTWKIGTIGQFFCSC
jgi:hypothetical protein